MSREAFLLPEREFCLANPKTIARTREQVGRAIDKTSLSFMIGADKPNRGWKSPVDPWKAPASPRGRYLLGPSEPQTEFNPEPRWHPLGGQGPITPQRLNPRPRPGEQAMSHEVGAL